MDGSTGPVEGIATAPLYVDVEVAKDSECVIPIPREHNGFVYVFEGEGVVGEKLLAAGQLGVLSRGESEAVRLVTTARKMRLLLLAAKPLDEPMARRGPFVMNTREEIREAFEDYQRGTFLG